MLRKISNRNRQLLFFVIYFGYSIFYQKISYPDDLNPWNVDALNCISFSLLFYGFYFASVIIFRNNNVEKLYFPAFLFVGIASFFLVQHIKNYYIFGISSGLFEYYLALIPEMFLMAVFAVIFAQIECSMAINELTINKLKAKNEKEILLNKAKLNKEVLLNKLDKLVEKAEMDANINELIDFRNLVGFMINSTHICLISIQLEIENLHRYIYLYNLRAEKPNLFNLEIIGDILDWQIPHKSVLTLVENAIKYGDLGEPIFIRIDTQPNILKIIVKNKISDQTSVINSTNIGLSNLKARFQLHLKNKHSIEFAKVDGYFEVCILVFVKSFVK